MHRNLGHPSVEKQMRTIELAEIKDLPKRDQREDQADRQTLPSMQMKKAKPRRFLFSVRDDITGEFNHVLEIDVVKLVDGSVLHTICSGTGFQQGRFLKDMTAPEAWNTLTKMLDQYICWGT